MVTNAWSKGLKFKQNFITVTAFSVSLAHADIVVSNTAWNVEQCTYRESLTFSLTFCLLEAIIVPTSCKAASGSQVSCARWRLLLLNQVELCILCIEQSSDVAAVGEERREGLCLLRGGSANGVSKLQMGRKLLWLLLSLEFRKSCELDSLENQTLASEKMVSYSWWHFWALSRVSVLSFWVWWVSFLSWVSRNNFFLLKSSKEMDTSFSVCLVRKHCLSEEVCVVQFTCFGLPM